MVVDGRRDQGCTLLLSANGAGDPGDGPSRKASILANGRFIAFASEAANLVDGDTNGVSDIFVVERDADEDGNFYSDATACVSGPIAVIRVSVASDGSQANGPSTEPDMAGNGDFIAFTSTADNLVSRQC